VIVLQNAIENQAQEGVAWIFDNGKNDAILLQWQMH